MATAMVLGTPVASTNKTDGQNITEILLKVASNTITFTLLQCISNKGNAKHGISPRLKT